MDAGLGLLFEAGFLESPDGFWMFLDGFGDFEDANHKHGAHLFKGSNSWVFFRFPLLSVSSFCDGHIFKRICLADLLFL